MMTRAGLQPKARAAWTYSCPLRAQNFTADQPRVTGPADQTERKDYMIEAGAQQGGKGDGKKNAGKRQQNIHGAHEQLIDPAAEITGDRADEEADGN